MIMLQISLTSFGSKFHELQSQVFIRLAMNRNKFFPACLTFSIVWDNTDYLHSLCCKSVQYFVLPYGSTASSKHWNDFLLEGHLPIRQALVIYWRKLCLKWSQIFYFKIGEAEFLLSMCVFYKTLYCKTMSAGVLLVEENNTDETTDWFFAA